MSGERRRRLALLARELGPHSHGPLYERVVGVVNDRLPSGDAYDRELAAVLQTGDWVVIERALDWEGLPRGGRLGLMDLVALTCNDGAARRAAYIDPLASAEELADVEAKLERALTMVSAMRVALLELEAARPAAGSRR